MNHEIEELFYDMFLELFRGRFKPVEESLMSSGIDCDDKWFFLLWHHCIELEKPYRHRPPPNTTQTTQPPHQSGNRHVTATMP